MLSSKINYIFVCALLFMMTITSIEINKEHFTFAQNNTLTLFPVNSKPYGLTYEDHVINYTKYLVSIPLDKNPGEDPTGERCLVGQNITHSSVFYLNGNSGGLTKKTCTIPDGLSLLIPIIMVEVSDAEISDATLEDLHRIARNDQDNVNSLYLKINEKEFTYDDLLEFRTHTKEFDVIFPNNAIFGAEPGDAKAVTDGFFVITSPLPAGNYSIEFQGSLACLGVDCTEPIFATHNIYDLIVK